MRSHEGIGESISEQKQESFESTEQERASIFRWLRERGSMIYLAAILAAGTPFKHEQPEAAEIPPGATWSEGIDILRNATFTDMVETKATFYIDQGGKLEKWIFGKEGERTKVQYKMTDIVGAAESELLVHPAQSIALCELHTHPISSGEGVDFISEADAKNIRQGKHSISFPPSGYAMSGDISLWQVGKLRNALKEITGKGVAVETRDGVIDPAGITYHRAIQDQDLQQEFPQYFAELKEKRMIYDEWEKAATPLLENFDTATVDRLHMLTEDSGRYDAGSPFAFLSTEKITELKRGDLKSALIAGAKGSEEIATELFADNPKVQKLYGDLVTRVHGSNDRDQKTLDRARQDWIKTSMAVSPEQLPATREYAKLREAFARNMAYIRFVPHQEVSNEPPCAGTDYKR